MDTKSEQFRLYCAGRFSILLALSQSTKYSAILALYEFWNGGHSHAWMAVQPPWHAAPSFCHAIALPPIGFVVVNII